MKRFVAVLLSAIMLLSFVTVASAADGYKDTVVVGVSTACASADAQTATTAGDKIVSKMLHMPLVFLNTITGELEPAVAESWEQTADATYVFHLRQGVKFHNGEELKASDVVYTFARGAENSGTKSVLSSIAECNALGDYTIELKLKAVDVDYVTKISDPLYSILSEKACTEDPANGGTIGCGPYVLDDFILNDRYTMHKFEDFYAADALKTNNFVFRYIPEASARLIALQNGEIDVCMNPAAIEVEYIEKDANLTLGQIASSRVMYLAFNCESELGSNMKLRQAIASAFQKEDVILVAAQGSGTVAKSFWSQDLFGYYDEFEGFSYDPEKAQALLAEAGFPNGVDIEIACTTADATAVQVIQAELSMIGVNVTISEMDSTGLNDYISQGNHTMIYQGKSYGATVEGPRKVYMSGLSANTAKYSNARVDECFTEGGQIADPAQRLPLYHEAQAILGEEVPYIPVYYPVIYWGACNNFEGVMPQGGGIFYFAYSYVAE